MHSQRHERRLKEKDKNYKKSKSSGEVINAAASNHEKNLPYRRKRSNTIMGNSELHLKRKSGPQLETIIKFAINFNFKVQKRNSEAFVDLSNNSFSVFSSYANFGIFDTNIDSIELVQDDMESHSVFSKVYFRLSNIVSLNLTSNGLVGLPGKDVLSAMTVLTTLILCDNRITSIDPNSLLVLIGKNTLQILDLNHNSIADIPNELYSVTSLRTLHISHNKLTRIDPAISNLRLLEELDVSSNNITGLLPSTIGSEMHSIQTLNVRDNNLVLQEIIDFGKFLIYQASMTTSLDELNNYE